MQSIIYIPGYVEFRFFPIAAYFNNNINKGNAKHGISPCLKIWPGDLDLWPWKSTGFQILLRTKYVPSLVKIHWKMLILECSQGCYRVKIRTCDLDLENQ
jgi:hypothetical protein